MQRILAILSVICAFAITSVAADKIPLDIPKWMRFVEITGTDVNLRTGPGVEFDKLEGEHFQLGEVVPVLDETDEWVQAYYAYSPTQYVWISKQYTREAHQEPLPDGYRFTSFQTYGDLMLTYKFDGRLTNIVYLPDYPFETARIWVDEPDQYKSGARFMSVIDTGIDWQTIMPKIIRTIPDQCVYKHLRGVPVMGESHNFRTDHDAEEFGQVFNYTVWVGDCIYELSIHALPTDKPDQLFIIAHSQSGLDGFVTDLLCSMYYNYKTGEYTDIKEGLPGVVIDKLGLNYDIFWDHPEYQRELRQSKVRHLDIMYFFGMPMVTVSGPELAMYYPIDTESIIGYTQKTTVYYLWDGEKFVKLVHSPYIDMLDLALCGFYDVRGSRSDEDFSQFYDYLMPFFAEACQEADAESARTGRPWLNFDPFTFLPKGQNFELMEVEVISAANRSDDTARVRVYPKNIKGQNGTKTVIVEAMTSYDAGTYLISDFKDENGVSVLQMAHKAKGKNQ